MSEVILNQWGNSLGLRVPAALAKQVKAYVGERFKVTVTGKGELLFSPVDDVRKGWLNALNTVADAEHDQDLLDIQNDFDQDEWTW